MSSNPYMAPTFYSNFPRPNFLVRIARLTSPFLAPICANFPFFLYLKHYMLLSIRFALSHYNRPISTTKMYNIHAHLSRSPILVFRELPSISPRALISLYIVAFLFLPSFRLSFTCPFRLFALLCCIIISSA